MAGRPQVLLSIGAKFGGGGIGNGLSKLAAGFRAARMLGGVICAGGSADQPFPLTVVNVDRFARLLMWTPARFRTSLLLTCRDAYFDLLASRNVRKLDLFFGWSNQALASMRKAKRLGMPCVLHAANLHVRESSRIVGQEFAQFRSRNNPYGRWMVRRIVAEYGEADLIRVESQLTQESLVRAGVAREKVALLPPAADVQRFSPRERPRGEMFTIAYVGPFSLRKGFHYLAEAFKRLRLPEATLILHGGPEDRVTGALTAQIAGMRGALIVGGDVRATYAIADVIVQPSLEDGFSYVVTEAMACGLPVIVTDRVGAKDLVEDGVNGFVVPAKDVSALQDRLRFLYTHRDRCREMGEAARKTVEQFTVERHGAELAAALGTLSA